MVVYKITNLVNGKAYVGLTTKTLEKRWKHHKSRFSRCWALKAAIAKYGAENFTIEELFRTDSPEELNAAEKRLIEEHATFGPGGYNLTAGGNGPADPEGTLLRQSVSRRGKTAWNKGQTTDTDPRIPNLRSGDERAEGIRQKIIAALRRRTMSADNKAKLVAANTGRKLSEEHKRKLAEKRRNSKIVKRITVICLNTGVVFPSYVEAAAAYGLNVSSVRQVALGNYKHTRGYRFERVKT